MYKSILVHVDNSKAVKTRVATALDLARRFKCSVTGVFLKSDLIPNLIIGDGVVMPAESIEAYVNERKAETDEAMRAARSSFDEVMQDASVPFWWMALSGDTPDDLAAMARRHDLVTLPPEMKPTLGQRTLTAAEIGMASGGPVLVLKHGGFPATVGGRVLVAWKDSREAARALHDAVPFLVHAEHITFLTVSSRDQDSGLADMLQRFLSAHGCKPASFISERNEDAEIGDLIRRQVGITGADLVVMGLYGHSRLREMVLGGVSRDLLHDLPMPLLVSH